MYFIFLNATEYGTLLCTNVACSLLFVSIGAPRCNLKTVFALPHFEEKKKKKEFHNFSPSLQCQHATIYIFNFP